MAVDVSAAVSGVGDVVVAVVAVASGVLVLAVCVMGASWVRSVLGLPPASGAGMTPAQRRAMFARIAAEGSSEAGGANGVATPSVPSDEERVEFERRSAVLQSWSDDIARISATGGVAVGAKANLARYTELVAEGIDSHSAVGRVEAENAAAFREYVDSGEAAAIVEKEHRKAYELGDF